MTWLGGGAALAPVAADELPDAAAAEDVVVVVVVVAAGCGAAGLLVPALLSLTRVSDALWSNFSCTEYFVV